MQGPVYNFSAGPAVLPDSVLSQAQQALVDWQGSGLSILSVSHRSDAFMEVVEESKKDLADLLGLSDDYHILFLQGGATAQFSMVPLNLYGAQKQSLYVDSGYWSQKAIAEAKRYGAVYVLPVDQLSALNAGKLELPAMDYLHCTPNETIDGVCLPEYPYISGVPLVGDFSSVLLSEPLKTEDFGVIYAGAQKNLGPAGVTVVIVRKDLAQSALPGTPATYVYQNHADKGSLYNTPPTFAWYVVGLVLQWLKQQGGLAAMAQHNMAKAQYLYACIDNSALYHNTVDVAWRSKMNVVFRLPTLELEHVFLGKAAEAGLLNLGGHRSMGGIRASLYNAMPLSGVQALVAFMQEFERQYGHG